MRVGAVEVATYGAGLKSCSVYLSDREQQNADEVAFVDWISGYLSGVNSAANHTNSMLGDTNLKGAVYWLVKYCHAHPDSSVAGAMHVLLIRSSSTTARHAVELATYGVGYKSCSAYMEAREQQSAEVLEFVDWLGGYVSGVNAISLNTNDILGSSDLTDTISWLDNYCRENPGVRFSAAAEARVTSTHPDKSASR
jgi:hypothetical protein